MSGVGVSGTMVRLAVGVALCFVLPLVAAAAAVFYARRRGDAVVNYRGVPVPLGLGWAWAAWGLGAWVVAGPVPGVLIAGVAVLGWIDDRFGDRATTGFGGHLRALARGRVTTGLLKLAGIAALAVWAVWLTGMRGQAPTAVRVADWLMAAAVIALAANLVNLLDRRPGRALKAYSLLAVGPVALFAANQLARSGGGPGLLPALQEVAVFFGPVFATWHLDVTERAMLGDMGANAAGALAGWLLVGVLPLPGLAVAAVLLLAANLASERVSFSAVIEGNRVLRGLDMLGRPAPGHDVRQASGRRNGDVI